ncbi:MAG: hypothetical protein ACRDWS_00520 [Acidimicrobiia bacterium]
MGVLAVVLTAPACSGGSETENPYRLAASGLCEASTKAETGDASGAGEVFYDIVHQPLHDLAAETSEVDRAVAARLLEAKEAVESGFDTNQPDLNEDFRALVVATDEALAATGHDPLACSSSEGS